MIIIYTLIFIIGIYNKNKEKEQKEVIDRQQKTIDKQIEMIKDLKK